MNEIAKGFISKEFSIKMKNELTDPNKLDRVKDYIIDTKAFSDMIQRERFNKQSSVIKNKKGICNFVKGQIDKLDEKSVDKFTVWHQEVMDLLGVNYGLSVGLAQKLINMSIKYYHFIEMGYKKKLCKNGVSRFIKYVDIPLDSFILKWFYYNSVLDDEVKQKTIPSWTNLTNLDDYRFLQNKIKGLLEKVNHDDCLIAETMIWDGVKEIRNVSGMEL